MISQCTLQCSHVTIRSGSNVHELEFVWPCKNIRMETKTMSYDLFRLDDRLQKRMSQTDPANPCLKSWYVMNWQRLKYSAYELEVKAGSKVWLTDSSKPGFGSISARRMVALYFSFGYTSVTMDLELPCIACFTLSFIEAPKVLSKLLMPLQTLHYVHSPFNPMRCSIFPATSVTGESRSTTRIERRVHVRSQETLLVR